MRTQPEIQQLRKQVERKARPRMPLVFRALADKNRYRIFMVLAEAEELCVTDIAKIFSVSVPAASYQLKVLETAGLIRGERVGQTICYTVERKNPVAKFLMKLT